MRTDAQRSDKFGQKCVGNDAKSRIDAGAGSQRDNFASTIGAQVDIETKVKQIVGGRILQVHLPYYIIFGKQLLSLKKRYRGEIYWNEMILLENLWVSRGLDFTILDDIKRLFWPSYPEANIFELDQSELDGEDRLG